MNETTVYNSKAAAFFYKHTGYSYDPKTETADEGRARCAVALATAENIANNHGVWFEWSPDDCTNRTFTDEGEEYQLWQCAAYCHDINDGAPPHLLASLGGIDLGPDGHARTPYHRVIEAELAAESLSQLLMD